MGRFSVRFYSIGVLATAAWLLTGCGGGGMAGGTGGGVGATGGAGGAGASAGRSGGSGGSTGAGGTTSGAGGTTTGAGGTTSGAGGTSSGTGGTSSGTGGTSSGTGGTGGTGGIYGTGGAGGAVPAPASAAELCTLFCSRLSICDTARDQQTCLYSCRDSNSALFPNLRTDLVAGIATCVQADDCATLDQSTSLGACVTQAAASLAPSSAGAAFCSALTTADAQCGITLNQADCLNSIKLYSDATIAQAMSCASKSCALIYSCASATLGQATGSWSLGGGIEPGQECSGTAYPCSEFDYDQTSCQAAGCSFSTSCSGTPYCTYEYSSTTCGALSGCTWNSTTSTCTGTPTVSCASMGASITTCEDFNPGCILNELCTGTTAACSTLSVTTCASHSGCTVVNAM